MQKIFKYELSETNKPVQMPRGASILSVGIDPSGTLCAWAIVDPSAALVPRRVEILGTGWDYEPRFNSAQFLGTVRQGPFMWHVFDFGEA